MAGNINNVNLAKFKVEMEAYDQTASKLHNAVTAIYNDLKNFKNCWSGKRVNTVITIWNNNYELISKQTFYFAMQIKLILMEIYNQYSALEAGKPKDSSYGYGWGGILKVNLTDVNTIKFTESQVKNLITDITSQNAKIKASLKELTNKLDSMKQYSDSLKSLHANYTANATNLQNTISKLCTQIQIEAEKAFNDTKITEGYNEKDAARAKTIK